MISPYLLTYLTKDDRRILTNYLARSKEHAIQICQELNPDCTKVLQCVHAEEWA